MMPILLASIGVDFKVAEAVDQVLLIVGMVPKKIFKSNPEYWYKECDRRTIVIETDSRSDTPDEGRD